MAQAEKFFSVQLSDYRTASGETYYAPDVAPRLPDEWKGAALNVLGLNNRPALHPAGILRATTATQANRRHNSRRHVCSARWSLSAPTTSRRSMRAGLNGEGQTIAMPEIDTFKQRDIDYYDRTYGITPYPSRSSRSMVGRIQRSR